ncbi:MAG: thiamine pyrophosphate-binding protein, partial [Acidobacteriota bacterium]
MRNLAEKRARAIKTGLVSEPQTQRQAPPEEGASLASTLIEQVATLGVQEAYGVSGGAIALLFDALAESSIALRHFRHETGAAFAATEAYFATRKPT